MDISHQGIGLPRTGCDLHIYTPLFVCWPTATVLGSSLRSAAVCFVVSVVFRLNEHPCLNATALSPVVLLAEMFTTLPALFTQLEALELSPKTRKAHTIALDAIVHELKLNTEQLKAVGNDPLKLTTVYQAKWDEDRAKLVGLPNKAVELAAEHGKLLAMHYCDKLTLLYSKEHYGHRGWISSRTPSAGATSAAAGNSCTQRRGRSVRPC
jgi:hypothetical protein